MSSRIIPAPKNGAAPFGVWAHGLHKAKDRDAMCRIFERLVANGVDIVFPCIKMPEAAVDYPSTVANQSEETLGRDPLQFMIDTAHEFSVKIHPWFCTFTEGPHSKLLQAHPEYQAIQNHPAKGLQSDRPELWAESLRWACSNRPEVLDYQFAMMVEVMDRYPADGVHFDYVRSGFYQCYCSECQRICKELTGADLLKEMGNFHPLAQLWYDYRVNQITSLVTRVGTYAHARGMETSAAVFSTYPLTYNEQAQDWPRWLQEGSLDLAIPMTYTTIPRETHAFTLGHAAVARDAGAGEMWEGIWAEPTSTELLGELARTALNAGSQGLVVFHYGDLTDEKFQAVRGAMQTAAC